MPTPLTQTPAPTAKRLARASAQLKAGEGFLVTDLNNIRYLSGFTGSSAALLLTTKTQGSGPYLITDFRYKEQSQREAPSLELRMTRKGLAEEALVLAKDLGIKRLGFETSVTYEMYERLSGNRGIKAEPVRDLLGRMRARKDEGEMVHIREAIRRAESSFLKVRPFIKAGVTEYSIARRLEERLRREGCRRLPFGIIVASGANGAMPHASASLKKLKPGDLVTIDWGGESGGYYSDMTRTLLVGGGGGGSDLSKKREIYDLVLKANRAAASKARAGMSVRELDRVARSIIDNAGYGEYFGHGLGHGVGLAVHEEPRLSRSGKGTVAKGMVFTLEPGIYVPGLGGVRIEDMAVLAAEGRAEVLTSLPRELEII